MIILDTVHKRVGKTKQQQMKITAGEAYSIWELLVARYDSLDSTQIYSEFIEDQDFKAIVLTGIKRLKEQIKELEDLMSKYGIPLVDRPPKKVTTSNNMPMIQDEFIFREIYGKMQSFMDLHNRAFRGAISKEFRDIFKRYAITELELFDKFIEYGKIKGWIQVPPPFTT